MTKIITDEFIRELQNIVGRKYVSASKVDAEVYSYDASSATGRSGVVVFPGDSQEIAKIVRSAHKAGLPFTPRGFGTNLSGGTVASSGGMVICLSRLNRILAVSPSRRCAVVQPGVTNLELQNVLGPIGYFYAPDPASQKVATLGGNVGENSGGPHCLKYGVTTNHILEVEAVLPDGEIVRFGGPALDAPGIDLRGALVGSEGTLGVTTEITVRILPKPETVITMLAIYDTVFDAAQSVSDIVAAGIVPATLEMMDAPVIQAVEDSYACGYPRDAAAVLIIELEGPSVGLEEQAEHIRELCLKNKCRRIHKAGDEEERDRLWEGRRGAFGAVARLSPNYILNDCTVPRTKLPEALARIEGIVSDYQLQHGNVFHAGDGNLHPLIFFDSRKPGQFEKAHKAGWEIMETCVQLGGTISGEHGIGLEKLEAMRLIFSEDDLDFQRSLKKAFDPENLANPGKVIPEPIKDAVQLQYEKKGQRSVGNMKAAAAVVEKVREAIHEQLTLSPVGNGTQPDFGNLCVGNPVPLESSSLSLIVEFDHANQVVTAGAGVSLEDLQEQLKPRNQWLPIRPLPFLQAHSLGGLAATGACGPERNFYGAPRDLLLGLQLVNPLGHLVSTGGKVIKNVAGYDMTRLMTGSMGTLGLITELTFRTAMIPERCLAVIARGSFESCSDAAREITDSNLEPIFLAAMPSMENDDSNPGETEWKILIGFEGFSKIVTYLEKKSSAVLEKHGLVHQSQVEYEVHDGLFKDVYKRLYRSPIIIRSNLPLDRLTNFVKAATAHLKIADFFIDYNSGLLTVGMEKMSDEAWSRTCGLVEKNAGHLRLDKAPDEFKLRHDVFGSPTPQWEIMSRIKRGLDPHNIFSPGRLPGKV